MFSFRCAKCGHLEMLHAEPTDLIYFFERNLWPDAEYQEEPPAELGDIKNLQAFTDFLNRPLRGYRHSLRDRHLFTYRKKDDPYTIQAFSSGEEWWIAQAPRRLRRRVRTTLAQKKKSEAHELEKRCRTPWSPPIHTYVIFDGTRSFVAIGE
jgi:hypothetical protein